MRRFAADRLREMAPGLDHIVHMPSHIDVRLGHWTDAVIANRKAIAVDRVYRARAAPRNFGTYRYHNRHMLTFALMMRGEACCADTVVRDMLLETPKDFAEKQALECDPYFAMPYEVYVRFGRWDSMLAASPPHSSFPVATAFWRFGRGIALAATKRVGEAENEEREFLVAQKMVPETSRFRGLTSRALLRIAEKMNFLFSLAS